MIVVDLFIILFDPDGNVLKSRHSPASSQGIQGILVGAVQYIMDMTISNFAKQFMTFTWLTVYGLVKTPQDLLTTSVTICQAREIPC